jgi:DNA repair protein RadC
MTNFSFKALPPEAKPRERLLKGGPEALTIQELLAIILRTGTRQKSVLDLAGELAGTSNKLRELTRPEYQDELLKIRGLGPAKVAMILAALELGKRISWTGLDEKQSVTTAREGAELLMPRLRFANTEHFLVVLLDTKSKVISIQEISRGSVNASLVHTREVFAPAVLYHASAILVGHNHPSGEVTPSRDDKELTANLLKAGKILGIPVVDHLIIGDGIFYSFKQHEDL